MSAHAVIQKITEDNTYVPLDAPASYRNGLRVQIKDSATNETYQITIVRTN